MRRVILVAIISALIFSCSAKEEKKKDGKVTEKIVSMDKAVGSLPCFKCHSSQKFHAKPQKGIFSHQIHMNTGYHCNQCHDFQGHKHVVINRHLCGNCHNIKLTRLQKTTMPARFNHESHAKKSGCRECHPKIFIMKAGTTSVNMDDIYKGSYCGACHNGKKAFSSSQCNRCHEMKGFDKELVYKVEGLGPVNFGHKFHTAAFQCDKCHPKLFAMKKTQGRMPMDKMNEGKFCGVCHNGNTASSVSECEKCHKG